MLCSPAAGSSFATCSPACTTTCTTVSNVILVLVGLQPNGHALHLYNIKIMTCAKLHWLVIGSCCMHMCLHITVSQDHVTCTIVLDIRKFSISATHSLYCTTHSLYCTTMCIAFALVLHFAPMNFSSFCGACAACFILCQQLLCSPYAGVHTETGGRLTSGPDASA